MRLSLSHPPESRRLLVAGSVCWIISGLDLRESLHAGGMDFGYPVFERSALNLIFDLALVAFLELRTRRAVRAVARGLHCLSFQKGQQWS